MEYNNPNLYIIGTNIDTNPGTKRTRQAHSLQRQGANNSVDTSCAYNVYYGGVITVVQPFKNHVHEDRKDRT
ncbi:hypothetical protein BMS3Abin07_00973 [bacterium BMS3Abin07]|nr:hypothetical protein BMS3Abin07_00973 [bacterium BMS3Abin07]